MQCSNCEGKGFKEFNHGLLQVTCAECKGTGEVDENSTRNRLHDMLPKAGEHPEEDLRNIPKKFANGGIDDSLTGTGSDNSTIGSGDTGKSKQPRKSKAKAKLSKRAG